MKEYSSLDKFCDAIRECNEKDILSSITLSIIVKNQKLIEFKSFGSEIDDGFYRFKDSVDLMDFIWYQNDIVKMIEQSPSSSDRTYSYDMSLSDNILVNTLDDGSCYFMWSFFDVKKHRKYM